MPAPVLADRLRSGETLLAVLSGLPEPLAAEAVARAGYDCVVIDMQHGQHDRASTRRGIGAVALAAGPAMVRIPVGANADASWVLDMGAEGVIAPMINSAAEARAFAAATRYPPVGERSWAPLRAMALRGVERPQAYLDTANATCLALAMIETREALDAVDDILAVEGIDGVFVGPSDLSVTLSDGRAIAPLDPGLDSPIRMIAGRAAAAGKIAGIFAVNIARARQFRDFGYRLIALGSDQACLAAGAVSLVEGFRAA